MVVTVGTRVHNAAAAAGSGSPGRRGRRRRWRLLPRSGRGMCADELLWERSRWAGGRRGRGCGFVAEGIEGATLQHTRHTYVDRVYEVP